MTPSNSPPLSSDGRRQEDKRLLDKTTPREIPSPLLRLQPSSINEAGGRVGRGEEGGQAR